MQKFSFHSHTNSLGRFDGKNTAEEMIRQAEKIGYTELGISNHYVCHENMPAEAVALERMYFNDFAKAEYVMRKMIEEIREAGAKSKIDVYVGFEVDYFPSAQWRNSFESFMKVADADYYVGSTHFFKDESEKNIWSFYYPKGLIETPSTEFLTMGLKKYWEDIVSAIKSGYFAFIAHFDLVNQFPHFKELSDKEGEFKVIEALAKYNHAYELNTSGWPRVGVQHPETWIIEELNKRNVPILISDDSHTVEHLGRLYDKAEDLLTSIGYKNRWSFKK